MKLRVVAVGRPARLLDSVIAEYEARAARYWSFEVVEVREERGGRSVPAERVRTAEAARILERVPAELELVALTRDGAALDSSAFAAQLQRAADEGRPGIAFAIGGAFGLGEGVLRAARRRLSLSAFTLPHELARLCLAEQIYRAGTIVRGEPYHKGAE